jgi:hypothetical protein
VKDMLAWVDTLRCAGTVHEEESVWRVSIPLATAQAGAVEAAFGPSPWHLAVRLTVTLEGFAEPFELDDTGGDVALVELEWDGELKPCEEHRTTYSAVLARQRRGDRVDKRERFGLLQTMSKCQHCNTPLKLAVRLDKPTALHMLAATMGYVLPDKVLIRVWFEQSAMVAQYTLHHMLRWPARCVLLLVPWDWSLNCAFVRSVNLAHPDFWTELLMAAAALKYQDEEELPRALNHRRLNLPPGYTLLPLEYWVSSRALDDGHLPSDLARHLHGGAMLMLGLLAAFATGVEAGASQLTFWVQRDQRMDVALHIGQDGIRVGDKLIDVTTLERPWLALYRTVFRGEKPRGNEAMFQNAILTAGGGRLESLLWDRAQIEAIQTYYRFQYDSLLEERFKQHVEITRMFLTQRQEAGAKAGAAVNDLYKTLATVLTGVGALTIVVVTAAITGKPDNLGNYLAATGAALGVAYMPAYLVWANSLVDDTLDRLKDFKEQLRWSARTLRFPEEQLHLESEVGKLADRLRRRSWLVLGLMFLLQIASLVLLWYAYFETGSNWLKLHLSPPTFRIGLGGWSLALAVGLGYRMKRRCDAVKEIKRTPINDKG